MKTFQEWLNERTLLESKDSNGRELIRLCRKEKWIDHQGVEAQFVGWEEGTRENKVILHHPIVGEMKITVSRRPRHLPEQILKSAIRDYKNEVEKRKRLKANREAV